jgi:tryptophan halogenase
MFQKVIVLGGGSAGFMAAAALKVKIPHLRVVVIRSKDIGIIGVGEGSTVVLTRFLHEYLRIGFRRFMDIARPSWKLGLRFLWGTRTYFNYPFSDGLETRVPGLPRPVGFYCDEQMEYEDQISAFMTHDKVFARLPDGGPNFHTHIAYHFENEKYVTFLEGFAAAMGVEILDDTVLEVKRDEGGVAGLVLQSGRTETAELYVDCSGFISLLLGKTLAEPFIPFKSSLFCDRAVVGGWARADEVIKPYTTCQTMNAGWCWQIEHEERINRGYVYSSDFIADDQAQREFRAVAPKVGPARIVKFITGRYRNVWVKNVVGIGNASGFVEPLEATALGVIAIQARYLADCLADSGGDVSESQKCVFNLYNARNWDGIRRFIAVHYKYNTRLETPFWRACREKTDLAGAEPVVEYFQQNGPSTVWGKTLLEQNDTFGLGGYLALLMGQKVPYRRTHTPTDNEIKGIQAWRARNREAAARAMTVREALAAIRTPGWTWKPP